ncbi:cobalt-precorrin-6A reductase [Streptomyces sp. NPDC046203]|uniref:cobalt-precorrin-6A reductase n=1 Tax=Streptomyces sp. NPDC046203 TaxID=3154602 RepID=UPI0033DF5A48
MHVLVLGGTTEARVLAGLLHEPGAPDEGEPHPAVPGVRVTSSLAGRVAAPRLPAGEVRIGGFGGPAGLAAWIREHSVDAVIDATHPFAERISFNAAEAAATAHVPLLALRRPGWVPRAGDVWHEVDSLAGAARLLGDLGASGGPGGSGSSGGPGGHGRTDTPAAPGSPSLHAPLGERVFLTTGRMGLAAFADCPQWFLVRSVDAPEGAMPARTEVLLDRGPFTLEGERELLARHRVDVLVTKDSGGAATAPKLTAAREAGIPVVVVRRPPVPPDTATAASPEEAAVWVRELREGRTRSA